MSVPDDPFKTDNAVPLYPTDYERSHQQREASPSPGVVPPITYPPSIHTPSGVLGGATGAKTPRRVQWTQHVVDVGHPAVHRMGDHPEARGAEDDHSLNAANLAHLQSELERHKSQSSEQSARPKFMLGGEDHDEDEEVSLNDGEEDYDYRLDTDGESRPDKKYGHRYRRQDRSSTSIHSSLASSVISEEDEDRHHRDRDDHEKDRAGDMGRLEKSLSHDEVNVDGAGGGVHPSAEGPISAEALIPEDNGPREPDVRDEMPVFVDPGETDGLPSMPPEHAGDDHHHHHFQHDEAAELESRASALVKAHKSGRFGNFLRNRKSGFSKGVQGVSSGAATVGKGATSVATGVGRGAMGVASGVGKGVAGAAGFGKGGANPSLGKYGMGMGGRPMGGTSAVAGGGVLASLLALYGDQQHGQSGASTPNTSRPPSYYSDSTDSEEERERERKWKKKQAKEEQRRRERDLKRAKKEQDYQMKKASMPAFQRKHASSDPPLPLGHDGQTQSQEDLRAPNAPFSKSHKSHSHGSLIDMARSSSPKIFGGVKKTVDKFGLELDEWERPKNAKSGAGVFGALAQSTSSLSGIATPAASTLAPNAQRPGYSLSRFSLDGRKSQDRPSRPQSLFERSSTPPHGSGNGDNGSPDSRTGMIDHPGLPRASTTDMGSKPGKMEGSKSRPLKGFNMKSLSDLTHLPITPGSGHFKSIIGAGRKSQAGSPSSEYGGDYFSEKHRLHEKYKSEDDRKREKWEAEKKKRKKAKEKKKQQEIFIIQHVAAILARQQFLMKLIRALMMFGSPTHRLEAQIQATARVLELSAQVVSLPGLVLISFNDEATHTSETKFLKQSGGLDLQRLLYTQNLYWEVVHDKLSAEEASKQLDVLMTSKPYYPLWAQIFIGGMCSSFICCV